MKLSDASSIARLRRCAALRMLLCALACVFAMNAAAALGVSAVGTSGPASAARTVCAQHAGGDRSAPAGDHGCCAAHACACGLASAALEFASLVLPATAPARGAHAAVPSARVDGFHAATPLRPPIA